MKLTCCFAVFFIFGLTFSQFKAQSFLTPADSLNQSRFKTVFITSTTLAAGAYIGLAESWYAHYPKTNFHFTNDNAQWLQMDKAGHLFTAYHLGKWGSELLVWSGVPKNKSVLYGSIFGFTAVSGIEILDGFSSKWGASWGDLAANAGGTLLFVGQEYLWKEQRIMPKFSFHTTPYASARPQVLGDPVVEQILKDYNGQTYWLSINVRAFLPNTKIPKWFNLAFGYGAEGMITGEDKLINTVFLPEQNRVRQFYFSLDADLTKIKTNSQLLKNLFSILNTIKIPAPTIELRGDGSIKLRAVYF